MWNHINKADFKALEDARIQLHQATQLIAVIGRCYNEPDPGDSYATLSWDHNLAGLVGKPTEGSGLSAYLRFEDLSIGLMAPDKSTSIDLDGMRFSEAQAAVQKMVAEAELDLAKLTFTLPYEIPEYSLTQGSGEFVLSQAGALKELSHYYANAHNLLMNFQQNTDSASEVICWPHHFDVATLVTLVAHADPEKAKSIGVGFSPGDANYNEPYFYLTPWPYPPVLDLPKVDTLGHWHTKDWVGRVLSASELLGLESKQQAKMTEAFVKGGFEIIKSII